MNQQPPETLSEKLIATQPVDDSLRQRYEKEIAKMFEQTLNGPRKISFMASVVICTIMTIAMTFAAVSTPGLPAGVRLGLGLGALYAAGWLVMSVRILRRGSVNLRKDSKLMSALPWVFTVALVTLILLMTGQKPDSVRSVWMLLYGLTFLLMASMFLIQHWISDARLKVEERLLEVQLRIAELAEEIKDRR